MYMIGNKNGSKPVYECNIVSCVLACAHQELFQPIYPAPITRKEFVYRHHCNGPLLEFYVCYKTSLWYGARKYTGRSCLHEWANKICINHFHAQDWLLGAMLKGNIVGMSMNLTTQKICSLTQIHTWNFSPDFVVLVNVMSNLSLAVFHVLLLLLVNGGSVSWSDAWESAPYRNSRFSGGSSAFICPPCVPFVISLEPPRPECCPSDSSLLQSLLQSRSSVLSKFW